MSAAATITAPPAEKRTRFEEFDIARAVATLGLPIVHVLEEGDSLGILAPGFMDAHVFLLVLSAAGAALFMACMGANMVFSRHTTPRELARRGVMLLAMGVLLNIARFALPDLVFGTISGNYSAADYWPLEVVGCDIYDFSGLCFLAFALFKKMGLSARQILATSVACLVLGAYVLPHFFANPVETFGTRFLGRFFWVNETSSFPLLTWLCFPALGYVFGTWFKDAGTDEARWTGLRKMMPIAAAVFAATAALVAATGGSVLLTYASPANDYVTDLPNVLLIGSSLVFVAAGAHRASVALQGSRVLAWFARTSQGIIPYYTSQWVIIGFLEVAVEDLGLRWIRLSETDFWLISVVIVFLCLGTSRLWLRIRHR